MQRKALTFLTLLAGLAGSAAVHANDFPTLERVNYVLECMSEHQGQDSALAAKCSCALDRVAAQMSYDDYVVISTHAKGATISGERGALFRDNDSIQKDARRWRSLQAEAKKACFIR